MGPSRAVEVTGLPCSSGAAEVALPCAVSPAPGSSARLSAVSAVPQATSTFQDRDARACRSVMAERTGLARATEVLSTAVVLEFLQYI